MPRSLFFKLMGAFALVILALAVTIAILVNRATADQFRLYADRNGQLWAAQLARQLADYYARQGSWQGVEAVLRGSGGLTAGPGMGMMGSGGMGMMGSGAAGAADMWAMMGLRVVLTDARGQVLSDSADLMTGQILPAAELAAGVPIRFNELTVGTVIGASLAAPVAASLAPPVATSPAGTFLKDVNRSILLAVLAAGVIALALGALLFFQMTAPIRQLTTAAHAISAGDLSKRVAVRSGDELGELAGAFNAMAANLAASEGQRRQMMADVAHELRTPISVMQANLEAMQDGILPTDAEQLASLHEETLLLGRLVADLRLLSLAEAGQLKLELTENDLCELVSRAAARLRPAAEAKGIALLIEPPAEPMAVTLDAGRITQVLGNLIDNALRYTPAGGEVVVRASQGSVETTEEEHRTSPPALLISVTDSGPGIAPDDLPQLFDRFYRADRSRARSTGGSGLGLAIVKQLVEAHGGRVWAMSPVRPVTAGMGPGARFVFAIPLSRSPTS